MPTISASAHPMGTDHQMPTIPTAGIADSAYASATRLPSDTTVSTMETPARPYPRNSPYNRKSKPMPT